MTAQGAPVDSKLDSIREFGRSVWKSPVFWATLALVYGSVSIYSVINPSIESLGQRHGGASTVEEVALYLAITALVALIAIYETGWFRRGEQ